MDGVEDMTLVQAPQRRHQDIFIPVTCEPMQDNIRAQTSDAGTEQVDIFLQCQRGILSAAVQFRQVRMLQDMKQLQLHPFNGQAVDVVHGFQQIFSCFPRQSHNDMSHHGNIVGGKAFHSISENGVVISSPDEMGRGFLCCLQSQFHPKFCFAVQFRQQLDYIISQTVRACGNGKPHNVRLG